MSYLKHLSTRTQIRVQVSRPSMGKHTAVTFIQIVSTYAADIYMYEFMAYVLQYLMFFTHMLYVCLSVFSCAKILLLKQLREDKV